MNAKDKRRTKVALIAIALVALAMIPLVAPALVASWLFGKWAMPTLSLLGMTLLMQDESLKITRAMPNANVTVASTGFDLGVSSRANFLATVQLEIAVPAVTTGELPNAQTFTCDVYHDTASDFSGETLLMASVVVQTGAGGAGAAAQTLQARFPDGVKRYVRVKITGSATAGNASAKNATLRLAF
jgi:hypothetical protein